MKELFAIATAIGLTSITGLSAAHASAYSEAVQKHCRADYKRYCSEYGLETNALRNCMNRHGDRLSKACLRALVRSGEVSQREVDRRKRATSR